MIEQFGHKILYHVAKQIKDGTDLKKDKLITAVMQDCFPQETPNPEQWYRVIDKRLEQLLTPTDDTEPLIQFLDQPCEHCHDTIAHCLHVCPTDAISEDSTGYKSINYDLCIECGQCVNHCISGVIAERSEFVQIAQMLLSTDEKPVFAILAPSFVGQFGARVQPEQIKGALKLLGFHAVHEVALAADIITTLEAQEFYRRNHTTDKFMITSCCCPAFIKLVEKRKPKLNGVVSESVSPMVALGRLLKANSPDCKVIFIGPCIAKKGEAKQPDLCDAIDCVLTYKETQILFEAAGVPRLDTMPALVLDQASHDGRSFAYTGGVSTAIINAIHDIDKTMEVTAVKGNGIKECVQLLEQAEQHNLQANFMEGMACLNGCVGGPGTIIPSELGIDFVKKHAQLAKWVRSMENHSALGWLEGYPSKRLLSSKLTENV